MKRIIKILKISACLLLVASPMHYKAQAGGIPVIDTVSIGHALTQLNEMAKDYQNQLEQLDQAIANYNAITGGRSMGDLLNSSAAKDLRRALPDNLQDMIGLNSAGSLGASASQTQSIYNDLLDKFNPISGATLYPDAPNSDLALAHDLYSQTTTAAMAASESSYNNASARMGNYETLLGELNNSGDLKASVDLLSRITAENGILMNEIMKIQALQMQLSAAEQNNNIINTRRVETAGKYDASVAYQSLIQQ